MPRIGEPTAQDIAEWVHEAAKSVAYNLHRGDLVKQAELRGSLVEHAANWLDVTRLSEVSPRGVKRYLLKVALYPRQVGYTLASEMLEQRLEEQLALKPQNDRWGQVRSYIREGIRVRAHQRRTTVEHEEQS